MPNVLLPVPGPPLIRISFGGSFVLLTGGGALNVRRCFMEAGNAVGCATLLFLAGGVTNADVVEKNDDAARRMAAADKQNLMVVQNQK